MCLCMFVCMCMCVWGGVILSHLHPSLIFAAKAMCLPLEWGLVRGNTRVGSSLACKYITWTEVTYSNKHNSLLRYGLNTGYKKFIVEVKAETSIYRLSTRFRSKLETVRLKKAKTLGSDVSKIEMKVRLTCSPGFKPFLAVIDDQSK